MTTTTAAQGANEARRAGVGRIALASLVGTTIEFYDFYIFGTAAALVFGPMFFPKSAPETQTLNAYLTFGLAFLARPVGSLPVRPFRRSDRTQIDARRDHVDHGARDDADRRAAVLRQRRRFRAVFACRFAFRSGGWAWRRMGWRGPDCGRKRAGGKARMVRHVPATRPSDRLPHRDRLLSSVAGRIWRGRLCRLGVAGPLSLERRSCCDRTLCARLARGDAGV